MNKQATLFENTGLDDEIQNWVTSDSDKGEVFTKPEIVRFMITISGLDGNLLKEETRVLEPSCGHGEFVAAIVESLCDEIDSVKEKPSVRSLLDKIKAFDLVERNIRETKEKVIQLLKRHYSSAEAKTLASTWLTKGDFLLCAVSNHFSHAIGNPPYIRVENIPKPILKQYRNIFETMNDRADIYIAFFEKSLSLLNNNGSLSFICTDRWVKNQYGRSLRAFIDSSFNLDLYVDLYGQDSFQTKVLTYPAITLISRADKRSTLILRNPVITRDLARKTRTAIEHPGFKIPRTFQRSVITNGKQPWLLGSRSRVALLRKLESKFGLIEDVGCKVFIGAATGNNTVFVVDENLNIEKDRLLPVVTSAMTRNGTIESDRKFIINTYDSEGVINLDGYPKLKKYFESYREVLSKRHVATSVPKYWFKTIDRVYPERAAREKLLIPDIGKYHGSYYSSFTRHQCRYC